MSSDPTYIYADNAATTRLSPAALDAMMPYLTDVFGNPSGIHRIARDAARALDAARRSLARSLGAEPHEVFITSGGSESDTWVLRGAIARAREIAGPDAKIHLITSSIEHHAILHTCRALEREGVQTTFLPVDNEGFVAVEDLEAALCSIEAGEDDGASRPVVALVSIMLANNEVGTIEHIPALAACAHAHGAPFHTDAVQAVGHIPVNFSELGVDALSLSAHKFHGPRGIGALVVREGFTLPPLIEGGAQERGLRAGTENVAGAVGMAAALADAVDHLEKRQTRVAAYRDDLAAHITSLPDVRLTGAIDDAHRLPSIASFVCKDVDGELLVVLLDRAGVAAATGSACSTGSTDPSHVITALGITDPRWTRGSLRLSLADDVSAEDVEALKERVANAITRARRMSGIAAGSIV